MTLSLEKSAYAQTKKFNQAEFSRFNDSETLKHLPRSLGFDLYREILAGPIAQEFLSSPIDSWNDFFPVKGFHFVDDTHCSVKSHRTRKHRKNNVPYDSWILTHHEIPSRYGSLHDFCNAAVWYLFPKTKEVITQIFHKERAIDLPKGANGRTSRQDWLTTVDEGGAVELKLGDCPTRILFGHGCLEQVLLGKTGFRPRVISLSFERLPSLEILDLNLSQLIEDEHFWGSRSN